jgi:hypothetical protein
MLRWQQAEGKRHALDASVQNWPAPHVEFRALCGAEVTPKRMDFHECGGKWLDPTCWDCDGVWRELEHIPQVSVEALP